MKIVIATDKWRGSFSSVEAGEAIGVGVRRARPGAHVQVVAVADGGEGTLEVVLRGAGGERLEAEVTGPLGRPVRASWGRLAGGRALVEMAQAAGLALMGEWERDPLRATTRGVGELVRAALDADCGEIVVALGGSATVDGGAGFLEALGFRLVDARGVELEPGGGALVDLAAIDVAGADPRLGGVRFEAWSDVTNPLVGPNGAARVFGPQKGAGAAAVARLEAGLERLAHVIERDAGVAVGGLPGAGAAGGLGGVLVAFLGARVRPGAACVLDAIGFDQLLEGVDLVVTGEGRYDGVAMPGKLPNRVGDCAAARGIPVALVCGLDTRREPRAAEVPFATVLSGADLGLAPGTVLGRSDLAALGELALRALSP